MKESLGINKNYLVFSILLLFVSVSYGQDNTFFSQQEQERIKRLQKEQLDNIRKEYALPDLLKQTEKLGQDKSRKETEQETLKKFIDEGNKSVQQQTPIKAPQEMLKEYIPEESKQKTENFYKDWKNPKKANCEKQCKNETDKGLLGCKNVDKKVECYEKVRERFESCKGGCERW